MNVNEFAIVVCCFGMIFVMVIFIGKILGIA